LGIGDWAQSPIPNPQSPIPNPHWYKEFYFIKTNLNKFLIIILIKIKISFDNK
jgi:hypothetical protein